MLESSNFNNEELLNRICAVYGFSQKIQLANHFNIAASSLQNRYKRGNMSYDFAVHCALETGANLRWLLTGEGERFEQSPTSSKKIEAFTLSEGKLKSDGSLNIEGQFFSKPLDNGTAVRADGKLYFIDKSASLSDGLWLVDIEDSISIRELTKLPGRRLHIAGGKVPFECGIDDIQTEGRVVGVYSEIN